MSMNTTDRINIPLLIHRTIALLLFGLLPISRAGPSAATAFVAHPELRTHKRGCLDRMQKPLHKLALDRRLGELAVSDDVAGELAATDDETDDGEADIGKAVSVIGKSTSAFVSLAFFAALAYRRDALMLSFFIGAISNGVLSKVLKRVLNQDRPEELDKSDHIKLKPSDKGMPSSHAMSLGFICTFTALSLPQSSIPLALYVLSSLYYRVKSKLHTTEQVLVGLAVGVSNGFLWRDLTSGISPIFPSVHVMDSVTKYVLPPSGIFPPIYLLIPALIGAAVVGSFERRISRWLSQRNVDESHDRKDD